MRAAARALCAALLLPAGFACQANDSVLERLDLRVSRPERHAPRFMLVPEPAFTMPAPNTLSRPTLAFKDGEGPLSLPVGALRVRLSGDSSLSLRPRSHGLSVAWRKRF
ncbi:hypothetical protein CLD22_13575 [Rubrivivax gelatinosus]|nr:hypothetical protein [Rubrivivax gelatinosus]